jgi:hypothetical protein
MKVRERVKGRVRTFDTSLGREVRIELFESGLRVRVKHARRSFSLDLRDVVALSMGQGVFRL